VAAASAKRLRATLLSAGVKQLGKEIIVVLQFHTACITTEQARYCIIELNYYMKCMALWVSLKEQHAAGDQLNNTVE